MRGKQKYRRWQWVVILFVLFLMGAEGFCKSVYAVASHGNGKVKAYKIDSNGSITYQATITNPMEGATGLTVWPAKDRLFVTYEEADKMSWASLRTLTRNPGTDDSSTGTGELGGMSISENMGVLYAVQRGSNLIYGFDYDAQSNTLIPYQLGSSTLYQTLTGINTGIDIAIDEEGSEFWGMPVGRLYASDMTTNVRYYDMMGWQHEGTIAFQRNVVGVGIDAQRGYLYAGNFDGGNGHSYLMRMDLDGDPNSYVEKYMGYMVMDIAVDAETGFIYLTGKNDSGYLGRPGLIAVYDPSGWVASDPNTLALMDMENDTDFVDDGPGGLGIGPTYKEQRGHIGKDDDTTSCVEPNDVFDYTIEYRAGPQDETNVVVTDRLPEGVDFISADPNTGTYYPRPEHKYVWELGDVPGWDPNVPGDPNVYLGLTVRVNTHAEPAGELNNQVETESDESIVKTEKTTPVCWWGGDIIYVKWDAAGEDIGTDWTNAYRSLSKALLRAALAADPNAVEVRIARGTYCPGSNVTDSFQIPAGIEVYGGWLGDPANPTERNAKQYETILSGQISDTLRNITVVKMDALTLLDGVTVERSGGTPDSPGRGILGQNVDFAISNCIIKDNQRFGIRAENGNATIRWCIISGNGYDGVRHIGNNSKTLTVENCRIFGNGQNGLYAGFSSMSMLNSIISSNGSDNGGTYYGVYVYQPSASPVMKNCSVVDNVYEGLYFVGFGTREPSIRNCILWGNKNDGQQLEGYRTAYYSCIYDPNNPNQTTPDSTYHNVSCDPTFVYGGQPEAAIYRLRAASPCIDRGDPGLSYDNQTDMDGEDRVCGTYADMGADEACACDGTLTDDDIYNVYDWDYDGLVNLNEFAVFALAWLSHDPNDPELNNPNSPMNDPNSPYYVSQTDKERWEPICDFVPNGDSQYVIDAADLLVWVEDSPWLWHACWRMDITAMLQEQQSMMMSMPEQSQQSATQQIEATPVETAVAEIVVPEKSIEEQLAEIKEAAKWLEELWLSEPELQSEIDVASWKNFMDAVYESVKELEQLNSETLPLSEELQ